MDNNNGTTPPSPPSGPSPGDNRRIGGYGYGYGTYGYGNSYSGYPERPVSVIWSRARIQVRRYLAVLRRLGWVLPLTVSIGICLSAWLVSQMPPDYVSTGKMMVSGQFQLKEGTSSYVEQMENYYGTQMELMKSLAVRTGAIARVQALHPELQPEAVILTVEQVPHASIFQLSVEARSDRYAKAYLDALMNEFIDAKRRLRQQKSDETTGSIQDVLTRLDKAIAEDDNAMHDFQKANNIGFIEKEGNDAAIYLAQKNRELADLKSEANLLQMLDLDQNLDRQRASIPAPATTDETDPASKQSAADPSSSNANGPVADYLKAKQQLQLLLSQQQQLGKNLRPAHPTMIALQKQIDTQKALIETLRAQSVDALKTRREAMQIQIKNLEDVIKEWEAKALDLSSRISEFNRLKTKADRDKEQYGTLLQDMTSVTATKNIDQDMIMISEQASDAVSVKPGLFKIVLAGFGGGLFAGLAILFCIDQLDDRIGSFIELQTHFQETILGQVPREEFSAEAPLLRHNDDRFALLEAFRSLRSSLIFFPAEGMRPKTLIVTSALPNEGKTTISANLAITLAFSGARTLIVDADMRRGRLSHLFGITEGDGLSSVLLKTVPWRQAIHKTTVDNLSLISCGPPLKHPAEHLLGKVFDDFLKEVYDQYDYIIFDTPPVAILDDTLSIAPKIDGTMIVVRFGVSSVRTTRRTLELLAQRQTNILGLICNDVKLAESQYNYGYYHRDTIDKYNKEVRATA